MSRIPTGVENTPGLRDTLDDEVSHTALRYGYTSFSMIVPMLASLLARSIVPDAVVPWLVKIPWSLGLD